MRKPGIQSLTEYAVGLLVVFGIGMTLTALIFAMAEVVS